MGSSASADDPTAPHPTPTHMVHAYLSCRYRQQRPGSPLTSAVVTASNGPDHTSNGVRQSTEPKDMALGWTWGTSGSAGPGIHARPTVDGSRAIARWGRGLKGWPRPCILLYGLPSIQPVSANSALSGKARRASGLGTSRWPAASRVYGTTGGKPPWPGRRATRLPAWPGAALFPTNLPPVTT